MDVALGGGVHAVLSPGVTTFMSELGLLSKGGRCRPFDADADGFVRGEGCGMVVLKRLADAETDGDRIWAVIRGSAVNQSGASAGLTVPNGPAQERVIEEALSRADIAPADVDYLEAHGTGSAMGDPIEVRAVAAVYGKGRTPERPLLIGSFKPNIGHPEAAAGIAGLIKVVLAMQEKLIPPQPDFRTPSPLIEWDKLPVEVTSQPTPWPLVAERPPRAGISAFGISGANAHVVVEGYGHSGDAYSPAPGMTVPAGAERPVPFVAPAPAGRTADAAVADTGPRARLLPLSGKSNEATSRAGEALSVMARKKRSPRSTEKAKNLILCSPTWHGPPASDEATLSTVRAWCSRICHRCASTWRTLGNSQDGPATGTPARIAFVFPDDMGMWAMAGEALYRSEPVFRSVLERCEVAFQDFADATLLEPLCGGKEGDAVFDDPSWSQPALYALECALVELWSSVGVRTGIVFGQGTGEIAAAQAAGVLALEDGLRLAAAKGRLPGATTRADSLASMEDTLAGITMSPGYAHVRERHDGTRVTARRRLDRR